MEAALLIKGDRLPQLPEDVRAADTFETHSTPSPTVSQDDSPTMDSPSEFSTKTVYLLNTPPPSLEIGPNKAKLNIPLSVIPSTTVGVGGVDGIVGVDVSMAIGG